MSGSWGGNAGGRARGARPTWWRPAVPLLVVVTVVVTTVAAGACGAAPAAARSASTPAVAKATAAPAHPHAAYAAAGGRHGQAHPDDCDVAPPDPSIVYLPEYGDTEQEICGVWSLEDAAIEFYAGLHGWAVGDARIAEVGEPEIAGIMESMLEQLAKVEVSDPSSMTADEQGAYDWLASIDQDFQETAAQDALNEYNKWDAQQCNYTPPSSIFTYDPMDQNACNPGGPSLGSLFAGLSPPTYDEFLSYGLYDADQAFGVGDSVNGGSDGLAVEDGITAGIGAAGTIMAGAAPQIYNALGGSLGNFLKFIRPYAYSGTKVRQARFQARLQNQQQSRVTQQQVKNTQAGEPDDVELDTIGEEEPDVLPEAGVDVDSVADLGADALSGPLAILMVAVTIAVIEGINVVQAAQIPSQLQANLDAAKNAAIASEVEDMLTDSTGAGYVENVQNFENQLTLAPVTIGNPPSSSCPSCTVQTTFPTGSSAAAALSAKPTFRRAGRARPASTPGTAGLGEQIQVTALYPNGTPSSWQWTSPTVDRIDTWPLGIDGGTYGPPEETVGISDGVAWSEQDGGAAANDQTADGLSGFLPSGEINYFDPAGHPQTAYVDGDQFATLTSPGSADVGGSDAGDECGTAGECTLSNSIVVMGLGGTAQLQDHLEGTDFLGQTCTANDPGTTDCLSDNLLPDGDLVPLGGSTTLTQTGKITQTGTGQLFRLTLVPDDGTPPGVLDTNQYNNYANDLLDGAPDGGDVAGQTVDLGDPDTSPLGYTTTYTWQIETKCPYDPANPPKTLEGVPVCSNSPDYGASELPADEQDLTTCTTSGTCDPANASDWQEDPAFHGDPVTTLTGQNITWTWPAAGTYHVRLITTDQYGVTQETDYDTVVSSPAAPFDGLSVSAATGTQPTFTYPSVMSPVKDGDALTLTGCLTSADFQGSTAYSTPEVTIGWGDGSATDSGTAGSSTDPNLTFTYDPGGPCTSPWEFTATHTYDVDTGELPFVQQQIAISIADVTTPPTPSNLLPPNGRPTSTQYSVYANVYPANPAPTFVSGASASTTATVGQGDTYTGYTTGVPADTITEAAASGVTEGGVSCTAGLPSGVGFDAFDDNSFVITGTAGVAAGGCYAITVAASNSFGTAYQQFVLNENQAPAITSASSAAAATGSPLSPFTFTTTGFPTAALSITNVACAPSCPSALPSDLTFKDNGDGTATLSSGGADLAARDTGTYTLTVKAASAAGSVTQTFTLTIGGPPTITSSATAGFTTQAGGGFTVTTAGYPTASLSCTIVYSGSPTGCTTGLGYTLIDSNFSTYGLYFTDQGNGTATLAGAPYQSGVYTLTVTATNAVGTATQTLTVYVSNTGGTQLTFVDSGNVVQYYPPSGEVPADAETYWQVGSAGVVTICSDAPNDALSIDGSLPAGLTLTNGAGSGCPGGDSSSTVSGTPTTPLTPGSQGSFADRVVDGAHGLALLDLYLTGPPGITSPGTATFTEDQAGSFTVTQGTLSSADGEGCFSETGTLPDGLTFTDNGNNTATLSGTPTASGQSQVTVTASDCNGTTADQTLTIDVLQPPQITSADAAGFSVGQGGTFTVTTNADAYPVPALSLSGPLPPGVSFADNGDGTGVITVAADAPATTTPAALTLTATSAAGSAGQDLTLAIGTAPDLTLPSSSSSVVPTVTRHHARPATAGPTTPASATFTEGSAVDYTFSATGTPAPAYTCTVSDAPCSSANLPAGLTFTDNGDGTATLSGTPTALGQTTLDVTAANGVGAAAAVELTVNVDTAPAFSGTTTSGSCSGASPSATADTFDAGTASSWRICTTGSPAPVMTLQSVTCATSAVSLPAGLTFTDNGDGSATIAGSAVNGGGAACPAGYTLVVSGANGAGTASATLTLDVQDEIVPTSSPDTPTFVAGAPNSYAVSASGQPTPSFAVDPSTALPSWLTLTDNGNGTATLSGTPPVADAGTTVALVVDETNGAAAPVSEPVTLTVAPVALTAASPPPATLAQPYSYTFTASGPATFSLASGSTLPAGLTLSPSGVLSGTPTELGRWPVSISVQSGSTTVSTSTINVVVEAGSHTLEISQFRSFGPNGLGDWFVQVDNPTAVPVPLKGWDLGLVSVTSGTPVLVPLGTGTLQPGQGAVVAGPAFSMHKLLRPAAYGPGLLDLPGGFEILAPDGTVTDVAGESGAPSGFVAGTGAAFPGTIDPSVQDAFVRHGYVLGHPADTDDNAADFTYMHAVLPQTVTFTSTPPDPARVGGTYTVAAKGGDSTRPVTFSIGGNSAPGACTVSGDVVSFTGTGRCVVKARQGRTGDYFAAPPVWQGMDVHKGAQAITFTSVPPSPARVGGTYTVAASGGASGQPVTFATGPSTAPGACTVSGDVVSLTGPGRCVVTARQAGTAEYDAAPQAHQGFDVHRGIQTITFTSTPPDPARYGGTYPVSATGGASGEPVTFSAGSHTHPAACTVSGETVTFTGLGLCVVKARQAGNADYGAAAAVWQGFDVKKATQAVAFTSTPPAHPTVGSGPYVVQAAGGASGQPITFTLGTDTTPGSCALTGATVTFTRHGVCVVVAHQAGNADYQAAPKRAQRIRVYAS